ncbi:MAG: Uncharacterised protein [Opitutia bacterium UBA7350]|nr:MAG: Uncharacterised protein [Opitutae bacterium UBA7350]
MICRFSASVLFILAIFFCGPLKAETIHLGIDVLQENKFRQIEGKRIGLLTHPAGVNRHRQSTIDILRRAPNVRLVALFGPEHGIYGDEKANQPIANNIDSRTGLPVYSLYGKYRRPAKFMLKGLDAMVIDLQDIGVRSYTYVSCMIYTMEACFANGVEVIILDRPNPLGGLKVDGPPLDPEWRSYVGDIFTPYLHGLTIGEIAFIARNTPGWLRSEHLSPAQLSRAKLTIIPMRGWKRDMLWPDTGLRWVPTSPYVPNLAAVLGYAMLGLGAQEGGFSHGIGTPHPFRFLRYKGKSANEVYQALARLSIPGLKFKIKRTQTKSGTEIEGVYVYLENWERLRPTEVSFYMMKLTAAWEPGKSFAESKRYKLFNKHVGSSAWWKEISTRDHRARVAQFIDLWSRQAQKFQQKYRRFWLY